MAQLVLEDDSIKEAISYFNTVSADANEKIDLLLATLSSACESGAISGETADALKKYTEHARQLQNVISEYGKTCAKLANDFLEEIDQIDGDLYE